MSKYVAILILAVTAGCGVCEDYSSQVHSARELAAFRMQALQKVCRAYDDLRVEVYEARHAQFEVEARLDNRSFAQAVEPTTIPNECIFAELYEALP